MLLLVPLDEEILQEEVIADAAHAIGGIRRCREMRVETGEGSAVAGVQEDLLKRDEALPQDVAHTVGVREDGLSPHL